MDETPLWYEMAYKKVTDQIVNKHVAVKSLKL